MDGDGQEDLFLSQISLPSQPVEIDGGGPLAKPMSMAGLRRFLAKKAGKV
jgi:hypothetical protein